MLSHPAERALGVRLLRLPEILELAAAELKPNILTDYLFDLANALQHVLRGMPGPQGRVARPARQPPGALRPDGADLEIRARLAWNRRRRPDVRSPDRCRRPDACPTAPDDRQHSGSLLDEHATGVRPEPLVPLRILIAVGSLRGSPGIAASA